MSVSLKYIVKRFNEYLKNHYFRDKITIENPPILNINSFARRNTKLKLKDFIEKFSKEEMEKFFKAMFTHLYEIEKKITSNNSNETVDIAIYNKENDKFKTETVYTAFFDEEIFFSKKKNKTKKSKNIIDIEKIKTTDINVIKSYYYSWLRFAENLLAIYIGVDKEIAKKVLNDLSRSRKFKNIYKELIKHMLINNYTKDQDVNYEIKVLNFSLFSIENYEKPVKEIVTQNFIENITKFTPDEILELLKKVNNNSWLYSNRYKDPKKDYGLVNQINIKQIFFINEEQLKILIEYFYKKAKRKLPELIYNLKQLNLYIVLKENEELFFNREYTIKEKQGIPSNVTKKTIEDKTKIINKILDELGIKINNFSIKTQEKEFLGLN